MIAGNNVYVIPPLPQTLWFLLGAHAELFRQHVCKSEFLGDSLNYMVYVPCAIVLDMAGVFLQG